MVSRLEVVDTGRRRRWSDDEKLRIVTESFVGPAAGVGDGAAAWVVEVTVVFLAQGLSRRPTWGCRWICPGDGCAGSCQGEWESGTLPD